MESNNYIVISPKRGMQANIYAYGDFFESEVIFKFEYNKIIISKPNIDYMGIQHKPTKIKNGYIINVVTNAPKGKFMFDPDESNGDQKVIYLD